MLPLPLFAADIGDSVSERAVTLDDVERCLVELSIFEESADDRIEPLVVTGLREVLNSTSESGLVSIGHQSFFSMRLSVEHIETVVSEWLRRVVIRIEGEPTPASLYCRGRKPTIGT